MLNKKSKQHLLALIMLSVTTVIWGAGFVLSSRLMENGSNFANLNHTLNFLRFGVASLVLVAVFFKQLNTRWSTLWRGMLGGLFLFGAFGLQLLALKYTTAASCGIYTAAYVIFVPFIAWIWQKKPPKAITLFGVIVALFGLDIFNRGNIAMTEKAIFGNVLALLGAFVLAFQIIWTEHCLSKKKVDAINLSVWQIVFATLLFLLVVILLEAKSIVTYFPQIDWGFSWWRIAIISIGGTAFAYISQTYAQKHLSSSETSLIMVCESPIGAVFSVLVGIDTFTWQLAIGGSLVVAAVILVEVVPTLQRKKISSPDQAQQGDKQSSVPDNQQQQ